MPEDKPLPPDTAPAAPVLSLPVAADIGGLEIARLQVRRHLEENGVGEHTVAATELVLEEVITNILRHGYGGYAGDDGAQHWIEIEVSIEPGAVQLLVVDDGTPFDPLAHAEPELPQSLDEAPIGGLGLLMIRRTASELAYERRGGHNRFNLSLTR
jgi:anti-sigma regulatory factor (Ser/Thr protein kinase)